MRVKQYKGSFSNDLPGEMLALGFDMTVTAEWKPLLVHKGMMNTVAHTSMTGTVLHDLNTEPGWSGAPSLERAAGRAGLAVTKPNGEVGLLPET